MKLIYRIFAVVALIAAACAGAQARSFVTIGSGSTTGLYYPTAVGIAKIITESDIGIGANARSTGGSVYNAGAVQKGQLQAALAQNNILYYAYNGTGIRAFQGKPAKDLRGLATLYPEMIHILVRKDSGIHGIQDLKGKRVDVGDIGSSTEQDVKNLLSIYGMKFNDLGSAVRSSAGQAVGLLRDGRIDAMFYSVGLGSSAITEAMQTAPITLISLSPDVLNKLHAQYPFYTAFTIPGGTYPGIDKDVHTVTFKATLFASKNMSSDDVYKIMNTLFNTKRDAFYNDIANPNLKKYFKLDNALEGMSIPLHPGAVRFYKEQHIKIDNKLMPTS
ncbi:MAG: TAXI family TRAP transporter solute-binding subunit [Salinisphaera sp.]|nr:TAXI family TRAP transporter solute-binding subunit [Salinisphaera sp.]